MLCVNMLIEWHQLAEATGQEETLRIERILWLNPSGVQVVLFDVEDEKAMPVWRERETVELAIKATKARILRADPYARLVLPGDELAAKHQAHRAEIWQIIGPLVETEAGEPRAEIFVAKERGQLVAARVDETGRSKRLIYRDLRRYWRGGQTKNALLPHFDRCGGKGQEHHSSGRKRGRPSNLAKVTHQPQGINADESVRQRFRRGIRLFYEKEKGRSLSQAFDLTLKKFFNVGYERQNGVLVPVLPPSTELPTLTQFRYWYDKERNLTRSLTVRLGARQFATKHRAILGDSTRMAFGPGWLYQFDATLADIYLVSTLNPPRIIGRPVLYLVIDVFSRLIVGFSVSLEGPSWLGAMLALENTTMDKVALCQTHGITIRPEQWPSQHLPQKILADRGELEGYNADQLVNGLGISVANTPPYRADWKGIVERYFRLSNERVIHWFPGAVQPDHQRGDRDYRLDACLTLPEFRQIMLHCILEHNNGYRMDWYDLDQPMIADHVDPYPVELWAWGIKNRVGHLRTAAADQIRLNLLPQGEAAIARDGLHFQGLRYDCELGRQEDWFVRARAYGRERVTVAYDPRLVDVIYLRLANQQRLEPCPLLDKHQAYRGRDWYDILDYLALAKQQHQTARSQQLQIEAAHEAQIDQIVSNARDRQTAMLETVAQQASRGRISKAARLKDIKQNRQQERAYEREQDHWQLAPAEGSTDHNPLPTPESGYVPPPQQTDLLRKLRQQKLNGGNPHEN